MGAEQNRFCAAMDLVRLKKATNNTNEINLEQHIHS